MNNINSLVNDIILGNDNALSSLNKILIEKIKFAIDNKKIQIAKNIIEEEKTEPNDLYDNLLTSALTDSSIEIILEDGSPIMVDSTSSKILLNYYEKLNDIEKNDFLNTIVNNERTFLKFLDTASNTEE